MHGSRRLLKTQLDWSRTIWCGIEVRLIVTTVPFLPCAKCPPPLVGQRSHSVVFTLLSEFNIGGDVFILLPNGSSDEESHNDRWLIADNLPCTRDC